MTVVCWDGQTLAADKRCGTSYPRVVTKIRRTKAGELIGVTGWIDQGIWLMDWYENSADPKQLPDWQKTQDTSCALIIVKPDGTVWVVGEFGIPWQVESPNHAIGSGRDFAAAAMHLGRNAAEAVAVASALCATCGDGIDTLTLETE